MNNKICAEIGINHSGNLDTAKRLINLANNAGCTHVKFQKRNPEVCVPDWKKTTRRDTPWGEMSYIDYKYKIEFGEEEYDEIFSFCSDLGISCFASVWDLDSVDFMKNYTPIGKIPSAHLTNTELIEYSRSQFETLIVSTGMSTEEDIEKAVDAGNPDVVMHSVSSYPCDLANLNLNYISHLKAKYPDLSIGYSGHEMGLETLPAVVALGTDWIERHVTLDQDSWGSDQSSSLEPYQVVRMVEIVKAVEKSLGDGGPRHILECEKDKKKSLRGK